MQNSAWHKITTQKMCECVLSHFSHVWIFVTLWTITCQAPLSLGFSRQEILEWVAMPSSRGSSQPRDRTSMLHLYLQAGALPLAPPGKLSINVNCYYYCHNDCYYFLNTKAFITENKRKKPIA